MRIAYQINQYSLRSRRSLRLIFFSGWQNERDIVIVRTPKVDIRLAPAPPDASRGSGQVCCFVIRDVLIEIPEE